MEIEGFMRYEEFRKNVKKFPLISVQHLKLSGYNQELKNQLLRWQEDGKIIHLRKGLYILNQDDRTINPSRFFIACELYKPSYISTEYALYFYGIIPERVIDITCVTTKKTIRFENAFGNFVYQHIKTNTFTGFYEVRDEAGLIYFMANPEKAVVDFVYLNLERFKGDYKEVLIESFRFQNTEELKMKKLKDYGELFGNEKLNKILKMVK